MQRPETILFPVSLWMCFVAFRMVSPYKDCCFTCNFEGYVIRLKVFTSMKKLGL